ncbi:MAG: hypothetical protein J0H55_03510 [Chitinophagaceae bacterium]|nr:hypothetical protein [Chitinophagaceae bacterium]
MKILINKIAPFKTDYAEKIIKTIDDFCEKYHHDLILLNGRDEKIACRNAKRVSLKIPSGKVLYKAWFRISFLAKIKKINPSLILTWDPLPLKGEIPQIVIAPEEAGKVLVAYGNTAKSEIERWKKFGEEVFITFSKKQSAALENTLKIKPDRIFQIYKIPDEDVTLDLEPDFQKIKENYSKGNEFFFASGYKEKRNITLLLKSFSVFKKWQHSGMELLISYEGDNQKSMLEDLLKNYRFHESVILIDRNEKDFFEIVRAAYAIIFDSVFDPDLKNFVFAMRNEVAVVAPEKSMYSEISGDEAAFLYQSDDKDSLARILLLAFREEDKKEKVVKVALEIVSAYHPGYFDRRFESVILGMMKDLSGTHSIKSVNSEKNQ